MINHLSPPPISLFALVVLEMEPEASVTLGKPSTTKLHPESSHAALKHSKPGFKLC